MLQSLRSSYAVVLGLCMANAACYRAPAQGYTPAAQRAQGAQSAAQRAQAAQSAPPADASTVPQGVAPSASRPVSPNELYQTWQVNKRSDHVIAYAAAQQYLQQSPNGPQAPELARWSAAYDKATGTAGAGGAHLGPAAAASGMAAESQSVPRQSDTAALNLNRQGSNSAASGGANNADSGPPFAETQDWLLGWLRSHSAHPADNLTNWYFDSCSLYAVTVKDGCYQRQFIDFAQVDPSSLKMVSSSKDNMQSFAINLRSSNQRPIYHEDPAQRNLGSSQNPLLGGACYESSDKARQAPDKTVHSYFVVNSTFDSDAEDDVRHALNAVAHLVKLCGGKPSPF